MLLSEILNTEKLTPTKIKMPLQKIIYSGNGNDFLKLHNGKNKFID